ncbi:MaoC family dehydratase [Cumulibacter manganitolerans]|uniref:MaoC family dehydratase n=1 Tax=Cumulibacter manganitolerans TaxID=1884992 RepID=UPI001E651904|nr:MaoC family dehydratase [Cumulibacter manganitolerans]
MAGQPDFSEFELVPHENRFESFHPGQRFVHHWGRTLTAADTMQFSTSTCAWRPLYVNREYAKADGHPDVPVNPALLLCTAVGLSVEDLSEGGGPFLGVNDVEFVRPVYPGVTITAESVVEETRESQSRPSAGIVTWRTTVTDETGEVVLTYRRTNLVRKGEPGEVPA